MGVVDSIRTKHLVYTSFRRIIHLSGLTILYTYTTVMASGFGHIKTNSSGFGYIGKKILRVWIYRKKLYQLNVIFFIYIILCIYHLLCKYWYSFVSNTFLFLKINNYKNKYIIDRSSLYWTSEACFFMSTKRKSASGKLRWLPHFLPNLENQYLIFKDRQHALLSR